MSIAELPKLMTVEEFLALPDDDSDRDLIRGELRERPMTKRNRFHAAAEARLTYFLQRWLREQSPTAGEVYSGEVGCILRRNPDSSVGIDVAYFSADAVARQSDATTLFDGPPVLAVKILSPSDNQESIAEKVTLYLESGVKLVWLVDPHFKTIIIHRPDVPPALANVEHQLTAEPFLPGLVIPVKELFA